MNEIQRRRTFAIISHPDAGKTTLTEKFLLFGGQIQVAGAVKSNKIRKTATSDWMDIEHAGTPRLCRRYVQNSYRRGQRNYRCGFGKRRGSADTKVDECVPYEKHSGNHIRKQNGPRRKRCL